MLQTNWSSGLHRPALYKGCAAVQTLRVRKAASLFNQLSASQQYFTPGRTAPIYPLAAATEAQKALDVEKKLNNYKVAVYSTSKYVTDFLEGPLMEHFPLSTFLQCRLDKDTAYLASGYDAIVIFVNDDCSKEVVDVLANCGVKTIALRNAGYDRVDLEATKARGMRVLRVPTYSPNSVAEHAVALVMAISRNLLPAKVRVDFGNFALSGLVGTEVSGKTVGVWGTGAIGSVFCKIMLSFGCKVIACDVTAKPELEAMGVQFVNQEVLVSEADIISLHLPLNSSTQRIVDSKILGAMKPGAILINVSRGALVDTDALIEALGSGRLGGAGLDVYENEEAIFFKDRSLLAREERMRTWDQRVAALRSYPNVIITPHIAFLTVEALANIADTTLANLTAAASGTQPPEARNEL